MISDRNLRGNRANCRHSTGPKTAAGRSRSAKNARRHGLRIPVQSDPALSAEVEIIARKIAGDGPPELVVLARRIGEAEIDVLRVRRARCEILSRELTTERWHFPVSMRNPRNKVAILRRALRLLDRGLPLSPELEEQLKLIFEGERFRKLPPRFGPDFAIFDRYEGRALSRRKSAIRAFDKARAACPSG